MNKVRQILFLMLAVMGTALGKVSAQVDTDFWFAVPYLVDAHDNSLRDGYGQLCVTSFDDTTHVVISQPGLTVPTDPKYFAPIPLTLPPHTSVDVPVAAGFLNRAAKDKLSQVGLHIESDRPITAYFAQVNANSEIYTLKGRNALGTFFIVGMQNIEGNAHSGNSSIDIVATEDNTKVNIATPVNQRTNPSTNNWSVTLQKGQVYTIMALNSNASSHLGGTVISADKPVAVNSNDDSVAASGQDLVGEQLVPFDLAGDSYIAIKHTANSREKLFLFAPQGQTINFRLNGGAQQRLVNGQAVAITGAVNYIEGDAPFVCFQLTGEEGELGGTVLPRLECTGSNEVVLKRRFSGKNEINLLVKTDQAVPQNFLFNGQPLASLSFQVVPAAPDWSYAIILNAPYDASGILSISNLHSIFHASVLDTGGGGTCSYGYFSGYNYVELIAESDKIFYQQDDVIHLSIDNATLFENVIWTFPDGSKHEGADVTNVVNDMSAAGTYMVEAASPDGCPIDSSRASVTIEVEAPPVPVLTVLLPETEFHLCDDGSDLLIDYEVTEGRAHTCETEIGDVFFSENLPALPRHTLDLPLDGILPGDYPITLTFKDTVQHIEKVFAAQLSLQYDPEGIFAQKWDNVLAIFSPEYSAYGLSFERAYQWYKNGQPLRNETGSYYHLANDSFETTDYYQVEVTRMADGVTQLTCPYYPHKPAYMPAPAATKHIIDGRVYIVVGDCRYNILGLPVKDSADISNQ